MGDVEGRQPSREADEPIVLCVPPRVSDRGSSRAQGGLAEGLIARPIWRGRCSGPQAFSLRRAWFDPPSPNRRAPLASSTSCFPKGRARVEDPRASGFLKPGPGSWIRDRRGAAPARQTRSVIGSEVISGPRLFGSDLAARNDRGIEGHTREIAGRVAQDARRASDSRSGGPMAPCAAGAPSKRGRLGPD